MSTINDGGPAFPLSSPAAEWSPERMDDAGKTTPAHWKASAGIGGMSLRDYFAAKAVAALIAEPPWHQGGTSVAARLSPPNDGDEAANFASAAYRIADAMLKERGA